MKRFMQLLAAGIFLAVLLQWSTPASAQYYGYGYGVRPYYGYGSIPYAPYAFDDGFYRTGIYGGLYNYGPTGFQSGGPLYGEYGFPGPGYYPPGTYGNYYTTNWWRWRW